MSITLPAFLVGTELMAALGLVEGVLAIFIGGFLTACIGYFTMRVGTGDPAFDLQHHPVLLREGRGRARST